VLVITLIRHWDVPPVVPADSPITEGFSAERAREVVVDLAACGVKYIGSPENEVCAAEAVQRHARLAAKALEGDLDVDVQSASGHFFLDFLGGLTNVYRNLTNVVVRLPGAGAPAANGPRCALLVGSHFDSTFGSPAASDANAEVAIMVELIRLFSSERLPVDLVFVFNGGEEMLMPAAHGFITSHPWASELCGVVNLESAGSGGRELLFQAGPQNRWVVDAYARGVRRPHGSSITQVLFQTGIIPGDTDYRIYRDFGGLAGVDFAVLANDWIYHTTQDDLAHMDFRSVQRYGETASQVVRGMASTLSAGRPTGAQRDEAAVFFDLAGAVFVSYPAPLAQRLHLAGALVAATWALRGRRAAVMFASGRLLASFAAAIAAALAGALLMSCTPGSLVASARPEISFLCYMPLAMGGFLMALLRSPVSNGSGNEATSTDMSSASTLLASVACTVFCYHPVTVPASYLFFIWSVIPLLGDVCAFFVPTTVEPILRVAGFVVPWLVHAQCFVLAVELVCPLSMRSGTLIPGDIIVGAAYGLIVGLALVFSARYSFSFPRKRGGLFLVITVCIGFVLALFTFPYSHDRPKRLYMQDTSRSKTDWNFVDPVGSGGTVVHGKQRYTPMESGLWTVAMDWNGVATIRDHAPFGLPRGSEPADDSAGVYGEVPHPLPLKLFVSKGVWAPKLPPSLPNRLGVQITALNKSTSGHKELSVSVAGGPHIMMAIGPSALVKAWSFGMNAGIATSNHDVSDSSLPDELPPVRPDCDCYWVLFNEGGTNPTRGRSEAFNFTLAVHPGDLRMDVWATHLDTASPEIEAQAQRMPHWVSFVGWVSELQVHELHV